MNARAQRADDARFVGSPEEAVAEPPHDGASVVRLADTVFMSEQQAAEWRAHLFEGTCDPSDATAAAACVSRSADVRASCNILPFATTDPGDGTAFGYTLLAGSGTGTGEGGIVVVGAENGGVDQQRAGRLYMYTMGSSDPVWVANGDGRSCGFGGVLAQGGDVDGDTRADILVSSRQGCAGRIWILAQSNGGVIRNIDCGGSCSTCGTALIAVGDVDGDGVRDIAAGDPGTTVPSVRVFSAATGSLLSSVECPDPGWAFGTALAAGDFDGDGHLDLVVGAVGQERSGPGYLTGRLYVYSGVGDSLLARVSLTPPFAGLAIPMKAVSAGPEARVSIVAGGWVSGAFLGCPSNMLGLASYRVVEPTGTWNIDRLTTVRGIAADFADVPDLDGDGMTDVFAVVQPTYCEGLIFGLVSRRDGTLLRSWAAPGDEVGQPLSVGAVADPEGGATTLVFAVQDGDAPLTCVPTAKVVAATAGTGQVVQTWRDPEMLRIGNPMAFRSPGGPGRLPARGSHGSGLAQFGEPDPG